MRFHSWRPGCNPIRVRDHVDLANFLCIAAALEQVLAVLPAMHSPTVNAQSDPNWLAIEVIIDEKQVRELVPALKKSGASGIIEYPLNKVIP